MLFHIKARVSLRYPVRYCSQLWQKLLIAIKDSWSLEIFKAKVKLCSCDDCTCNLCKRFITNIGYVWLIWLTFFLNFSRCLIVKKLLWLLSTSNKEMYVYIRMWWESKTYIMSICNSCSVFRKGGIKFVPSESRLHIVDFSETKSRRYSKKKKFEEKS